MFKLIGNEYSKLFSRKTTQLLLLLLLLATIGLAFFFHLPLFNSSDSYETVASSSSGTEAAAEENTMSLEETLHARTEEAKLNYSQLKAQSDNGTPVDPSELEDAHNAYLIAQYIEDHQLESSLTFDSYGYPVTDSYLIRTLCQAPMLVTLLALVMIVVAGGIIANEFSQGTIKFLLINPVRRGKILWSKYLCCLSLLAGLFFLLFGLETLFLGFSYGFSAYGGQYVQVINGGGNRNANPAVRLPAIPAGQCKSAAHDDHGICHQLSVPQLSPLHRTGPGRTDGRKHHHPNPLPVGSGRRQVPAIFQHKSGGYRSRNTILPESVTHIRSSHTDCLYGSVPANRIRRLHPKRSIVFV